MVDNVIEVLEGDVVSVVMILVVVELEDGHEQPLQLKPSLSAASHEEKEKKPEESHMRQSLELGS